MKFTLDWLKDHLETTATAAQIEEALTMIGLEVESVEDTAKALKPFVVALVAHAEPHPNSDHLNICKVDAGTGTLIDVVCGAPNVKTGMKSVFAFPGTYIPGKDFELKAGVVIRGAPSNGMLCSAAELQLSNDHDGIIALPDDAPVGMSYVEYAHLGGIVFDISITPNRGDATGIYGVARDLAAFGGVRAYRSGRGTGARHPRHRRGRAQAQTEPEDPRQGRQPEPVLGRLQDGTAIHLGRAECRGELFEMLPIVVIGPEAAVADHREMLCRDLAQLHAAVQRLGRCRQRDIGRQYELHAVTGRGFRLRDGGRHLQLARCGRLRHRCGHRERPLALVLAEDVSGKNRERKVAGILGVRHHDDFRHDVGRIAPQFDIAHLPYDLVTGLFNGAGKQRHEGHQQGEE